MFGAEEAHPLLEQGAALPPGRMPGVRPRAATPTGPRVRSRCHCWRWAASMVRIIMWRRTESDGGGAGGTILRKNKVEKSVILRIWWLKDGRPLNLCFSMPFVGGFAAAKLPMASYVSSPGLRRLASRSIRHYNDLSFQIWMCCLRVARPAVPTRSFGGMPRGGGALSGRARLSHVS